MSKSYWRRPVSISLACFLFALGVFTSSACAANVAYIPGDSLFSTILKEHWMTKLNERDRSVEFDYAICRTPDFRGYGGFWKIKVTNVSPALAQSLNDVYRSLRTKTPKIVSIKVDSNGRKSEHEINGFHMLIYNRDVQWSGQRVGLKYNEKWNAPPDDARPRSKEGFGALLTIIHYPPLFKSYKATIHDWRDGPRYSPLAVVVPKGLRWAEAAPKIMTPVSVDASNIQFVILPRADLEKYYERRYSFLSVSEDGVVECSWKHRRELIIEDWSGRGGAAK